MRSRRSRARNPSLLQNPAPHRWQVADREARAVPGMPLERAALDSGTLRKPRLLLDRKCPFVGGDGAFALAPTPPASHSGGQQG